MTDAAELITEDSRQFLTFILADEEYAVDILRVQEIRGWMPVTRIPNAPSYMKGVLNLRGAIIPVVDLRARFGLETRDYGPTTVVVVVWVNTGQKQRCIGLVVDAVAETYTIPISEIRGAPMMGSGIDPAYIEGLATVDEKMVILMDIDYLLNTGDLECEAADHAPAESA
jgi:purine-binding chemotaxis protein CheW